MYLDFLCFIEFLCFRVIWFFIDITPNYQVSQTTFKSGIIDQPKVSFRILNITLSDRVVSEDFVSINEHYK